jgi:hypothetical protein
MPVLPLLKKGLHDTDAAVRITAAGSLLQHISRLTQSPSHRRRKG